MNKKFAAFFLLLVISINILWGIGSVPLLDPDEPVYAETAREMIEFNDYLSPRIFNEYWYDKPPMYYWLVAGAFKITGVSDFSARLPSGILGIATVFMLYLFLKRLSSEDTAFWSAMVLGTCVEFFYLGKAAVTDMTLLFFMTGALLCFLNRKYWVMYIFMGLATLTKGPIGIVFPGAIIFLYLLAMQQLGELKRMHIGWGVLIYLVVASPWYYLMYSVHGQVFIDTFFGFNNITRFTTPEHPSRVVWYYYIPVLVLGLFPWTGLFLSSLKASYTESSGNDFDLMIFMNIWWIFVFIFFTISKTKLVSYIFPLFPPIAIIIGWNISRLINERYRKTETFIGVSSILMFLLLACGWVYGGTFFPELMTAGRVLGGITALFAIAIGMALLKYKDVKLAVLCHVLAGTVTMFVVFSFILPQLASRLSVKQVATYYTENCDLTANIYVDKFLRPGFMYYTHIPGEELKPGVGDAYTIPENSANNYIIVRGLEYRRWDGTMADKVQEIYNTGDIYLFRQIKNTPQ